MHRLNRAEYANAIRDLLALDVDAAALLPPDDESSGFDNIADVLTVSPSLMERYLSASWNISRLAVGNLDIAPSTSVYRVRPDLSQDQHVEGLPPGTRGGILVRHTFPLDGEYTIKLRLWRNTFDLMRGMEDPHDIEIAMDGQRLTLVTAGGREQFLKMAENPGTFGTDLDQRLDGQGAGEGGHAHALGDDRPEEPRRPRRPDQAVPADHRRRPRHHGRSVGGPPDDRRSMRRDRLGRYAFSPEDLRLHTRLGGNGRETKADAPRGSCRRWRGPPTVVPSTSTTVDTLMDFYRQGRAGVTGSSAFDRGIESALQFILASPEFLVRFESDPPNLAPNAAYRLDDLALASRLSFFLWSSLPDDQLLTLASQGKLKDPVVLEQQVKRMLADARSQALVTNFAEQWLHLRNLKSSAPDLEAFPDFDDNLRQAMKEETSLFFDSIVREDRSVVDLLNADYTFVNERLARHYGIPNVYGSQFRRVTVAERSPARAARSGQRAHRHLVSESDLAGRARQMDPDQSPGRAAAASAAQYPAAAGDLRRRQGALAARAHGAAPRQSGLRGLSQGDGSDWLRARELRRHRPLAEAPRTARPSIRPARSSTAPTWTASSGSAGISSPSRRSSSA